jgi:hypothetical protein
MDPRRLLERLRRGHVYRIQPLRGRAKPYQVVQFLRLLEDYNLQLEDDR